MNDENRQKIARIISKEELKKFILPNEREGRSSFRLKFFYETLTAYDILLLHTISYYRQED